MSKKKKSGAKRNTSTSAAPAKNSAKASAKQPQQAHSNQPPKWGMVVAGIFAFLVVSAAIVVMDKVGINNSMVRTLVVLGLAIAAGLGARPLTLALQKRIRDK